MEVIMWKYVKKYLIFGILAALSMVGEVLMDLLQPEIMGRIVDEGVLGLYNGGVSDMNLIWQLGIQMAGIVLFGGLTGSLCSLFAQLIGQNVGNEIRKDCFGRMMNFSFGQMDRFGAGSLITRVTNDITQVQTYVTVFVRSVVRMAMMTFGSIYFISRLNRQYGLTVLCAVPFILLCLIYCLRKGNPLFVKLQAQLDRINAVMQEDVSGMRMIKACVREIYEKVRFGKANEELIKTQLQVLVIFSFMNPIINAIMYLAVAFILLAGSYQAAAGATTPGDIMAALTYTTRLLNGIMMLVMISQNISRGLASWKRLKEVLECEPELKDGNYGANGCESEQKDGSYGIGGNGSELKDGSYGTDEHESELKNGKGTICEKWAETEIGVQEYGKPEVTEDWKCHGQGEIEFRDVSFSYPGSSRLVLEHINLNIHKGETVAIMGATGCGKSTLANLIPRFYDVTGGAVLVNGVDVRDYRLKDLRRKIAIALQKSELFSESIAENIAWGRPGVSQEEIRAAAVVAQADDFITERKDGYQSLVAERGTSLSGGQKQRLSIARAVVKDAEILIFDDSTSALDLKTEALLYEALQKAKPERTKLVIAQRIASVRRADRIVVLEQGRIVSVGSHEELLRNCKTYQDIYYSQMGEEDEQNGRNA